MLIDFNDLLDSNDVIIILEAIYMTWFTIEFLVRFFSCPDYCKFIRSFMNIIERFFCIRNTFLTIIFFKIRENLGPFLPDVVDRLEARC